MTYIQEAQEALHVVMKKMKSAMFSRMEQKNQGTMLVLDVILKIQESEEPFVTPTKIAQVSKLTTPRVSAVLAELEKKGEVQRTPNPENRRKTTVSLTPKGKKKAEETRCELQERMQYVFEEMGEEKTRAFIELLKEFISLQIAFYKKGNEVARKETFSK